MILVARCNGTFLYTSVSILTSSVILWNSHVVSQTDIHFAFKARGVMYSAVAIVACTMYRCPLLGLGVSKSYWQNSCGLFCRSIYSLCCHVLTCQIFIRKNPTRYNNVSKFYYSVFIWSSTCFGRHTAHHQEPKTALAASGFSYVEGCCTGSWWTLSGTVCLTTSNNYTYNNLPRMTNQRLPVQF